MHNNFSIKSNLKISKVKVEQSVFLQKLDTNQPSIPYFDALLTQLPFERFFGPELGAML
jgi:hypothetical protein